MITFSICQLLLWSSATSAGYTFIVVLSNVGPYTFIVVLSNVGPYNLYWGPQQYRPADINLLELISINLLEKIHRCTNPGFLRERCLYVGVSLDLIGTASPIIGGEVTYLIGTTLQMIGVAVADLLRTASY